MLSKCEHPWFREFSSCAELNTASPATHLTEPSLVFYEKCSALVLQ